MASAFSNQIPVLLIFLLFLVEAAALKCYQQPGIDLDSIEMGGGPPTKEEMERFTKQIEDSKDKRIEKECIDGPVRCVVAIGCKKPFREVLDFRGCGPADPKFCEVEFSHCKQCHMCDGDFCNGEKVTQKEDTTNLTSTGENVAVAFSSMLMIAMGLFVSFVPIIMVVG